VDARDLYAQLAPIPRLRKRNMAHVVLEIEIRIIDPIRHVHAAGQLGQPPSERRRKMQPSVDLAQDALEGDSAVGCCRLVVDQQHLDLHRSLGLLGTQHHVVGPAQLFHIHPIRRDPKLTRFPRPSAAY
jgi:hypothetical protein